ncbi:ankyrin repeat protein,protein kinase family protein [Cylindrospermum stagnale PCC 7417]|uniref:non-specific serine/threonine protein kinase n=1 Tax=Cylindrospermum stagnale PCC 7417 TaxID=56107 RepID=K9X493_9NOST|nr:ankyrin repeat domain-containing protein [Cylindrospermum stagnale]AFZ26487.1 ankyrin repeat protein,protein kinase family protein [Cylindrospermum stagnale PCC 7417]
MELLHQREDIIAHQYRILDTLGQGGSGTTYLAQDLKSTQQVALKALSLHRMTDWKMMELFEREAKILSQLNHPGIPEYLGYFQIETLEDRYFYIAQQLAEGKTLAELVESGWRTSEDQVRRIAIQILEILVYLHSLKPPVVHRDIKPQNIIRRDDGQVFLVDFGAVQHTYYTTFMRGSTVVGTYGYMAPEQFRGQAVPATDLYALGATLLFLLTHRSPADLQSDELKINFRPRVQISEEFADWLEKMLEPDTEDRFSSAQNALEVLQGKRKLTVKSNVSVQWKKRVGVAITAVSAVSAVTTISLLNSHKWEILSSIGFTDLAGKNILYIASEQGNKQVVKQQLAKGANVNSQNFYSATPLHVAAEQGNKDIVELLITKGAAVNTKNNDGNTPLHLADDPDLVELLITKGAAVNAKNNDGNTPLHLADDPDLVKLLIAKGADVNVMNSSSRTPVQEREERERQREVERNSRSVGGK